MNRPFAVRVKEGLADRGLTLRELCRRAAVDPSLLSKVLSGKRAPPGEEKVLRRLAAALGLPAVQLVVSAGLLPSEWSRLNDDPDLLESVSRAIAKEPGAEVPAPRPSEAARPRELPPRRRDLEEELL